MENDKIITGYKATDENMCCRGFQFELGTWHSYDGELKLCESGFHFCEHPSGPWAYYRSGRLFKVEAKEVMLSTGPGADLKHVARHIRLTEEIKITGNQNTGNQNTGYRNAGNQNTGNRNTGDRNAGDRNAGNQNTGDWNAGDQNTGYRNAGNGNTGDQNTGYRNTGYGNAGNGNTGDQNTGYRNTGYQNTGDQNTGYGNAGNQNTGNGNTGNGNAGNQNTGYGNAGNYHSGCLNFGDAKFFIFNKEAQRSAVDFDLVYKLSNLLMSEDQIDPEPFLSLPNATTEAINALHEAHIKARHAAQKSLRASLNGS